MNMLLKENDEKYGFIKEDEYYNILKEKFDKTLIKNSRYNLFDFIGEDCCIELKSRRNTHNKYPDTMIGSNKIDYAMNNNKSVIFCFLFTDGLFYYKFDKNDVFNKRLRIGSGGRCDRNVNEYKDYCYIPISLLTKVEKP